MIKLRFEFEHLLVFEALFLIFSVTGINAPKVTITLGSDDDSKKDGSRRGSIARQVARDIDDTEDEEQRNILSSNSNNTSETILE